MLESWRVVGWKVEAMVVVGVRRNRRRHRHSRTREGEADMTASSAGCGAQPPHGLALSIELCTRSLSREDYNQNYPLDSDVVLA
jgi:hypothetical protein